MNKQDPPLILQIDSQRYQGWQDVCVALSLEQLADNFSMTVTERWAGVDQVRPIRPGPACTISLGNEQILTGYVDEVLATYDASHHSLMARGRSMAGDLVDCSGAELKLKAISGRGGTFISCLFAPSIHSGICFHQLRHRNIIGRHHLLNDCRFHLFGITSHYSLFQSALSLESS